MYLGEKQLLQDILLGTSLCQEVCPEEAIFLQDTFSLSGYTREEMVFGKDKLLKLGGTLPDNHFKWDKKKQAEENPECHHQFVEKA